MTPPPAFLPGRKNHSSSGLGRLLVADVHLGDTARNHVFFDFLRDDGRRADELYLLGDVVDAWLGDDDGGVLANTLRRELSALTAAGVRLLVQRGNHDFLMGRRFCREVGGMMLPDEHVLTLADGRRLLLMHGDTLCGDAAYMRYRRWVRGRLFAGVAGLLPFAARRWVAKKMLRQSGRRHRPVKIQLSLAAAALRRHHCQTLIHGHTHAPGEERWRDDGQTLTRYCLPAWESAPGYIGIDEGGVNLHSLPPAAKPGKR